MKYVTKPRAYWSDDLEAEINYPTQITVVEQGEAFEPTGLIDDKGDELFKVKSPIGFVHHDT